MASSVISDEKTFREIVKKSLDECTEEEKRNPTQIPDITSEQLAEIVGSQRPNATKPY